MSIVLCEKEKQITKIWFKSLVKKKKNILCYEYTSPSGSITVCPDSVIKTVII